jgi:hypothetical protein
MTLLRGLLAVGHSGVLRSVTYWWLVRCQPKLSKPKQTCNRGRRWRWPVPETERVSKREMLWPYQHMHTCLGALVLPRDEVVLTGTY